MSTIKAEGTQAGSSKKSVKSLFQDARIDAAHPLNGQDPEPTLAISLDTDSLIADSAESAPIEETDRYRKDDLTSEQLQRQAEQLAKFLRERQRELDHRESQLNAEISQLESDVRNARLWLSEREAALEQRREELDLREAEFLERLDRLAAAEASLEHQAETEADPSGASTHYSIEGEQLAQQAAKLKEERRRWEIQRQEAENALKQRQQKLDEAEKLLLKAQAETERFNEQLSAQRRELEEEIHRERQRLIIEQRETLAELGKKRQILRQRSEHVDQRRAALVQLRAELQQIHRETLEIRLTAEELWLKLSGAAPPDELTLSLGQIRDRLADQYRLANAELLKQKKGLKGIHNEVVEQYEKLVEQKRLFERCMAVKQEEWQEQVSTLSARAQAVLQQQTRIEEQSGQWQVERMHYEQEIRRLHLQLARRSEESAKG